MEDTIFCIPKATLGTGSGFFEYMLLLPPNANMEGITEECPLHLDGIELKDFNCLVDYLFHKYVQCS